MKTMLAILSAGLLVFSTGVAAEHDDWRRGYAPQYRWAHQYANTAVRQADQARWLGCGFRGSRWSTSYDRHYRWALRADRYSLERETALRQDGLRACRSHGRHGHDRDFAYRRGYGDGPHDGYRHRDHRRRW